MSPATFYSPARIAIFIACFTLLLTLALIPTRAAERLPMLGEVADADVVAAIAVRVVDEGATDLARAEAAAQVAPVLIFDAGVRPREVATLSATLDAIDAVRSDRGLSETEQGRALDAIPDLSVGPADFLLLELNPRDWRAVREESLGLLTDILTGNISDADVVTVRETMEERVADDLNNEQMRLVTALVAPRVSANITTDAQATEAARVDARLRIDEVTWPSPRAT